MGSFCWTFLIYGLLLLNSTEMHTLSALILCSLAVYGACQSAPSPHCGSGKTLQELLDNPPPAYDGDCLTPGIVKEFLGSRKTVEAVTTCYLEDICGKKGYAVLIRVLLENFGKDFGCVANCGKNKQLIDSAIRRFHKRYPKLFGKVLQKLGSQGR